MKYILAFLLTFSSLPAVAKITCEENEMTTNRYCRSETKDAGNSFYFFATNDIGDKANLLIVFGGLSSAPRLDAIMVKLDSGAPFKVDALGLSPKVNCSGYGSCKWTAGAVSIFSDEQYQQIANASRMLVSYVQGAYVSDPIQVDPKTIGAWFQEWKSMTQTPAQQDISTDADPKK